MISVFSSDFKLGIADARYRTTAMPKKTPLNKYLPCTSYISETARHISTKFGLRGYLISHTIRNVNCFILVDSKVIVLLMKTNFLRSIYL